jgi:teichuronic acid biosynthesis glycosyltransferase TuaG
MPKIPLISVVIPTFNRFRYLLNTIESVRKQTYQNVEIIVANDCSTQKEYYEYDWDQNGIKVIHSKKNSREILGHPNPGGHTRNLGIGVSKGEYVAFCDDDDIWFPNKLQLQIDAMQRTGCQMSSTEGLMGHGVYDPTKRYKIYNREYFLDNLKEIYGDLLDDGFPEIWDLEFLKMHNCMICSSVVLRKDIIDKVGEFAMLRRCVDYEYWLRALQYTNSVYVDEVCFYYDNGSNKNY